MFLEVTKKREQKSPSYQEAGRISNIHQELWKQKEKIAKKMGAKKEKIAKKMGAKKEKTYFGRPIEELKREAGIGKYKDRYK